MLLCWKGWAVAIHLDLVLSLQSHWWKLQQAGDLIGLQGKGHLCPISGVHCSLFAPEKGSMNQGQEQQIETQSGPQGRLKFRALSLSRHSAILNPLERMRPWRASLGRLDLPFAGPQCGSQTESGQAGTGNPTRLPSSLYLDKCCTFCQKHILCCCAQREILKSHGGQF